MTHHDQAEIKFVELMAELFQLDEAERLDFGFYRVIRHHNQEVKDFLGEIARDGDAKSLKGGKLTQLLHDAFAKADAEGTAGDQQRIKELESAFGIKPGTSEADRKATLDGLEAIPAMRGQVTEYRSLSDQLRAGDTVASDHREVLNRLYQFFSRHYQDGDFIVERRYGREGSRYIRSTGEDTEFHWATEDMYYIKSGDTFADFPVRLSNGDRIVFSVEPGELHETRANLNPTDKAHYELDRVEKDDAGQVVVQLKYLKGAQSNAQKTAIAEALQEHVNADEAELRHWLNHFIARNQSDFFIHKRLGEALRDDIDIFLKTEVLNADQLLIDTDLPRRMIKVGRIIREIGLQIIDFLAVMEDFQKALWEKKKLVFETRYIITLDRIAKLAGENWLEDNLPKIISAQKSAWEKLGFGNYDVPAQCKEEVDGDLASERSERWLPLPLDTKNFDGSFKWELIQAVSASEPLDEALDGLAIRSDNFQSLNLIGDKYQGKIETLYNDPPYNTDAGPISYKNGYKHASWLALMSDRHTALKKLLSRNAMLCITIDDSELHRLRSFIDLEMSEYSVLGTCPIKNNPAGRTATSGFSICHEYALFLGIEGWANVSRLDHSDAQKARYKEKDDIGHFEWTNFRKHGGVNTYRTTRPRQFYPFYSDGSTVRIPSMEWDNDLRDWLVLEEPTTNETTILPIDSKGNERIWDFTATTAEKHLKHFDLRNDSRGEPAIYRKWRINDEGLLPQTWWDKKEYSAVEYGTNLLTRMFGSTQRFIFPKSVHAVSDCLKVAGLKNNLEGWALDCFGGSATTAHAVMLLNQGDHGNRRFMVLEANEYFEAATLPRIVKAGFSQGWKDGLALDSLGLGLFVRVQELEQYEDTLENLVIEDAQGHADNLFDDPVFAIKYKLDRQARSLYQSIDNFRSPFGHTIKCARGGGEAVSREVDLVESLIYLLGLDVAQLYREDHGVVITGTDRRNRSVAVLFRECGKDGNPEWAAAKMKKHEADRYLTNAMPELRFEGCDRFEAIEAVFATQFGAR